MSAAEAKPVGRQSIAQYSSCKIKWSKTENPSRGNERRKGGKFF
jgi:hypothetical protein